MTLSPSVVEPIRTAGPSAFGTSYATGFFWQCPQVVAPAQFLGFSTFSQPSAMTAPSKLRPSPVLPDGKNISSGWNETPLQSRTRTMPTSRGSSESRAKSPCWQSDPSWGDPRREQVPHLLTLSQPPSLLLTQDEQLASHLAPWSNQDWSPIIAASNRKPN